MLNVQVGSSVSNIHPYFVPILQRVAQFGVWLDRHLKGLPIELSGRELISTHVCLFVTHRGTAQVKYDMHEQTIISNDIAFLMPGHIVQFNSASDDFEFSRLFISPDLFKEMRYHALSHDVQRFHNQPICHLEETQMERLHALGEIFAAILNHNTPDLPLQRKMLQNQLAVAYEFINYYRRKQDEQWTENKHRGLYDRFCALVIDNYRRSREVKYYAHLLSVTTKHLTNAVRSVAGITPSEWIDHYVLTRAKQMVEVRPERTMQEIAYDLGFCEPAAFHHFFKRTSGMTAKQYREST